jgi:hypothetical protein
MKVRELVFFAAIATGILVFTYMTRQVKDRELIGSRNIVLAAFFSFARIATAVLIVVITVIFPVFFIIDAIAIGILIFSYKRSGSVVRSTVLAGLFIFFSIAAGIGILRYALRPVTDVKSAVVQANQLIASVGGPTKVCDEAKQIFKRLRVSEATTRDLTYAELSDCPAIASLGRASKFGRAAIHGGGGDFPPYIDMRFGSHWNCYWIVIADTNGPAKYPGSTYTAELADSCIFVHR